MSLSKRTIGVVIVAAIVVVCAAWAVHTHRETRNETNTQATADPPQNFAPAAAVAIVRRSPAESSITVPGVFQAYQDILVHAKVSGYIQHIYVDIGDRVHTGEVLAVLEVPELNAQVQAAAAEMTSDKSELQRARNDESRAIAVHSALHSEYARLKSAAAAEPGLIAEQELDDAQAKDLSSEANIDAAKSAYAAAKGRLSEDRANLARYKAEQSYSYVRAPFNGVVTYRYADTGSLIAAGTDETKSAMPIVRLEQSDVLRLRMPVPAADADFIRVGGPAIVQVQATGETIRTKIVRFTRAMSQSTRTMLTEVDIPNHDFHLDPGMYATTTFPIQQERHALAVPIDGIVEGDHPYVLIVNRRDRVEKRPVVLGIQGANYYEVAHGINAGERVIIGNQSNYQPGEKVTPSPVNINLVTFEQTSSQPQPEQPQPRRSQPQQEVAQPASGQPAAAERRM